MRILSIHVHVIILSHWRAPSPLNPIPCARNTFFTFLFFIIPLFCRLLRTTRRIQLPLFYVSSYMTLTQYVDILFDMRDIFFMVCSIHVVIHPHTNTYHRHSWISSNLFLSIKLAAMGEQRKEDIYLVQTHRNANQHSLYLYLCLVFNIWLQTPNIGFIMLSVCVSTMAQNNNLSSFRWRKVGVCGKSFTKNAPPSNRQYFDWTHRA